MDTGLVIIIVLLALGLGAGLALLLARRGTSDAGVETRLAQIEGRFAQANESQTNSQGELVRTLLARLEALDKRLGDSLKDSAEKTAATIGSIGERLTVIDAAQKNIVALSDRVVSLQDILADKQSRGAWGQDRMEDIVRDQLPPELYSFQAALSNGNRPDCIIKIPGMALAIVVDAKFPLEAFEAMKGAADDNARKLAMAQLRASVQKHIKDIAGKYLIEGEVQLPAIMFVPSESIYSELHHSFSDVLQWAKRSQVAIVSPHTFWLAVNTIRTLMRDAKMREQAHEIQKEVGALLKDVKLMGERVGELRTHFERTSKDIGEIEKPMKRIEQRGARIEGAELAAPEETDAPQIGHSDRLVN